MQYLDFSAISTDWLAKDLFNGIDIEVAVCRFDRVHPFVSGNKWFKLRYYLEDAIHAGKHGIITFGGAYSNHILATAMACREQGLACTGIIRGEEPATLSTTLREASRLGMKLIFVPRHAYSNKIIPPAIFHLDHLVIPEGGYGQRGARGAATMADHFSLDYFTDILCAVGTGTTMAGLINACRTNQQVTGVSVLKNNVQLTEAVTSLLTDHSYPFTISHDYSFGGYAKYQPALIEFMNWWYTNTNIPSDFVYTGKLFFAAFDMIQKRYFMPGSRVLIIHSGGLQGNTSLNKGTLIF
jgi:1-aminocyclopropane-1-carboxylate deaminase